MIVPNHSWQVLLVGGNSGAGKTSLASELAQHFDVPWIMVDDLRLTVEWITTPEDYPNLHVFDDLSSVYQQPPKRVVEWRIANAEATCRAIEIVIANHVENAGPIILEGDDLTPTFAARRDYTGVAVPSGSIGAIFLIESDESVIEANMRSRGRWFSKRSPAHQRNLVHVSALYGAWLRDEAARLGYPVVSPRPFDTLVTRVVQALE